MSSFFVRCGLVFTGLPRKDADLRRRNPAAYSPADRLPTENHRRGEPSHTGADGATHQAAGLFERWASRRRKGGFFFVPAGRAGRLDRVATAAGRTVSGSLRACTHRGGRAKADRLTTSSWRADRTHTDLHSESEQLHVKLERIKLDRCRTANARPGCEKTPPGQTNELGRSAG